MKKLYRRKGTVHPSPPIISDHLSFLPATILTLTAALSPEDREVLAYLISCSNNNSSNFQGPRRNAHKATSCAKPNSVNGTDHPPLFNCDCFGCYMSYWIRWDLSPNRQLIHEIIDAFEDGLLLMAQNKKMKSKKERRKRGYNNNNNDGSGELKRFELRKDELGESGSVEETSSGDVEEGTVKDSVRKLVSFIGERIWGAVWT